jgi:hypothetical protein
VYVRRTHQSFWRWADVVAPGLFVMQAIGRWGNFFNQELYGPPTTLPWGIQIDAAHRVGDYVDLVRFPVATTHFHPLFLYESVSGIVGALVLIWLARRRTLPLVAGDLLLIFFIWYGLTRFGLEGLRTGNWTFFGIPTAQIVTLGFILSGVAGLLYRHGPGRPDVVAADLLPDRSDEPGPALDEDDFWADDDEADDDTPDEDEPDEDEPDEDEDDEDEGDEDEPDEDEADEDEADDEEPEAEGDEDFEDEDEDEDDFDDEEPEAEADEDFDEEDEELESDDEEEEPPELELESDDDEDLHPEDRPPKPPKAASRR